MHNIVFAGKLLKIERSHFGSDQFFKARYARGIKRMSLLSTCILHTLLKIDLLKNFALIKI